MDSVNPDKTYSVVLHHKTSVPLESRDADEETPQAMSLVNRKCMWRKRVVPPNIHHYVAVSLAAFLRFIARSDEAEAAKQMALARAQVSRRSLVVGCCVLIHHSAAQVRCDAMRCQVHCASLASLHTTCIHAPRVVETMCCCPIVF